MAFLASWNSMLKPKRLGWILELSLRPIFDFMARPYFIICSSSLELSRLMVIGLSSRLMILPLLGPLKIIFLYL